VFIFFYLGYHVTDLTQPFK